MKLQNTKDMDQTVISSEVHFYTIEQLAKMLGWSENTVQKLFNDPNFPSADFGRSKVVESHALIDYFSKKHVKARERYWR
ncbi:MAG: helix-turn-helix domain-containing protein [Bacteroidales bacterium]|nr:helix-turn-helix domain-containing protein [Bacteroidales bacterium]